jgi:hypothetical protein
MFILYSQDYIEDNDSLALLHDQIHECDSILSQIGSILSGFQVGDVHYCVSVFQVGS